MFLAQLPERRWGVHEQKGALEEDGVSALQKRVRADVRQAEASRSRRNKSSRSCSIAAARKRRAPLQASRIGLAFPRGGPGAGLGRPERCLGRPQLKTTRNEANQLQAFINHLGKEAGSVACVTYAKRSEPPTTLRNKTNIQNNFDGLGTQAESNRIAFNRKKCRVFRKQK